MKNIIIKDKKQYLILLKKLFDKCDSFKICSQTFDIMKKYSNFFDVKVENEIEYYTSFNEDIQLDISFFKDNNCIFYTTVHEGICMIEE